MIELGWIEAAVSVVALFLASIVFSATGFGIGMISTPLMLLVYEPQTVIVVAGTAGLGVGVWIITKSWRDIPFREILPIAIAALCGAPIAVFILKTADSSILSIGIAVLIILFAIGSFVKVEREIPYSTPVGILAGFIVGVLLPTSGVAGSLVMLFLDDKELAAANRQGGDGVLSGVADVVLRHPVRALGLVHALGSDADRRSGNPNSDRLSDWRDAGQPPE